MILYIGIRDLREGKVAQTVILTLVKRGVLFLLGIAVQMEQQKGVLNIGGDNAVQSFREKSTNDGALINAGYMVLQPEIFDYIEGDATVFEREPMEKLAAEGQLMSYTHKGFWQCMDNKREKDLLEKLWESGQAPWKCWD